MFLTTPLNLSLWFYTRVMQSSLRKTVVLFILFSRLFQYRARKKINNLKLQLIAMTVIEF